MIVSLREVLMPEPILDSSETEEREILKDPEVRKALAELDDPEDREDLIDALVVIKRIQDGKEKTHTLDEVKKKLGL
jgi:hypothetical protein